MPRGAVLALLVTLAVPAEAGAKPRVSARDPDGGPRWTATQSTRSGRTCVRISRGSRVRATTCARVDRRVVFAYDVRTERGLTPRKTRTVLVATFAPNVVSASVATPDGRRSYRRRRGRARVLFVVLAGRVERPVLTAKVRTAAGTTVVRSAQAPAVQVADPIGGPAWRSRTAQASGGDVCVAWERVPPRFAATPSPEAGRPACGDPDRDVPVAAAQTVDGRLVVFGLAGPAVRSAVLRTPSGDRTVGLEPSTRALLAVVRADTDPAQLRLVVRLGDGREVERPLDVKG